MNIGERIKILRASKDITQEEFGERHPYSSENFYLFFFAYIAQHC